MEAQAKALLAVRNLKTHFFTDAGVARAVDDVSFELWPGKTLALVGESGCGKSVTALSILRLVPQPPGKIVSGAVVLDGTDLLKLPERDMRHIRGNRISMVFQEPMTSLNPVFRVGAQIAAAIRLHRKTSWAEARAQTIQLLAKVGIPSPEERADDYPHQMSGGMCQRAMIAMALACNPVLLIADEPTTAVDVTIQAQILDLLCALQAETGMSILLITHNLGIVAEIAHEVAVMYAGRIVEHAPVRDLFASPKHPYTHCLFQSLPDLQEPHKPLRMIEGQVPAAMDFPSGCRFHPRCPFAMPVCSMREPPPLLVGEKHSAACWLHDEPTMSAQGRPIGLPEREEALA